MLIVALVLAVIGLAALVAAVVTSNELIAWICIGASVLGVILLIIDAIRERQARDLVTADSAATVVGVGAAQTVDETYENFDEDYPEGTDELAADAQLVADPESDVELDAVGDTEDPDVVPVTEVVDVVDDGEAAEIAAAVPDGDLAVDEETPVVEDAESDTEVHYVSADDVDSDIEVDHVGAEDPDSVIEDVTDEAGTQDDTTRQ